MSLLWSFILNDVALMDRLRYNLLSLSQLCDADLSVVFCKFDSRILDSSVKCVCGISHIENIFQANFFICSVFFEVLDFTVFFRALKVV
jgi:hypothetical protein